MIYQIARELFKEYGPSIVESRLKDSELPLKGFLNSVNTALTKAVVSKSDVSIEDMDKIPDSVLNERLDTRTGKQLGILGSRSLLRKKEDQYVKNELNIRRAPSNVTTLDKNSAVFVSSRPDVLSFLSTSPIHKGDEYYITIEKADYSKRDDRHVTKYVDLRTYNTDVLKTTGRVGVRRVNVKLETALGSKFFSKNLMRYRDSDLTEESKQKYFRYLLKTSEDKDGISRYVLDFNNNDILNMGLYGANAVGTLVALAPWNVCTEDFFKELTTRLELPNIEENHKLIQLPVPKVQKIRDNVMRTADSARFIYAHNPFFNNFYTSDTAEVVRDITHWETGRHIKGSSYWYKDKDGLPSVIRPMHFNSFISTISKYGYSFHAKRANDKGMLSGTAYQEEDTPARTFMTSSLVTNPSNERPTTKDLYVTNNILEKLNDSLKHKIVVTDFKRINLTATDIDKDTRNCPILDSYLTEGYTVINTDNSQDQIYKEIFEDMLTRIRGGSKDLYAGSKSEEDILKDVMDRSTGKVCSSEVIEDILKPNLDNNPNKSPSYDVIANLVVQEGGLKGPFPVDSFGNSNYDLSPYDGVNFARRDIVIKTNPVLTPDLTNEVNDFIETDKGYTIGKNEILIRSQHPSGRILLSVIRSFSVCLVKHTVIDTRDFESSSEEVMYDENSELLIGKIYRDVEKTKEVIANNLHPRSKGYNDKKFGGYTFKYLRNVDDSNPRDIYINVLGNVEHVIAEDIVGYETAVEIYREGKRVKYVPKIDFEKEGIFYTESLACSFSRYDTKLQYNHSLNELGKSELASHDLETKKLIAERNAIADKAKHDLEVLKIESELEKLSMSKDLELAKYKGTLAKYRLELEKIAMSMDQLEKERMQLLVKIEHDLRKEHQSEPINSQLLDFVNLVGKSAAAGSAVLNLYRMVKATV